MRAFAVQHVEDLAAQYFSQAKGQAVATAGASHQGPLLHPQGLPAAQKDWQARARRQATDSARTTASAATARDLHPVQPWQQAVTQAVLQLEGQMLQGFLQLMANAQPAHAEARLAATSPTRAAGLKPWPSAQQTSPEDLAKELTGGPPVISQADAASQCRRQMKDAACTLGNTGAVYQDLPIEPARAIDINSSIVTGLITTWLTVCETPALEQALCPPGELTAALATQKRKLQVRLRKSQQRAHHLEGQLQEATTGAAHRQSPATVADCLPGEHSGAQPAAS